MRPVVNVVDQQFSTIFILNKTITVEESIWTIKGSHQVLQYVPNKEAWSGLKVYKFCSHKGPEASYTTAFCNYIRQDCRELHASMKEMVDLLEKGA